MVGWIVSSLIGWTAAAVLFGLYGKDRKELRRLRDSVADFNAGKGTPPELPLQENVLAELSSEILELEERLLLARDMAQEERRLVCDMTADISHQLKTPLTTLRLYTEMDEAPHRDASLQQISRMEALIYGLLRLEKLSADGYSFRFAGLELGSLIREQWDSLSPVWPDRQLSLSGSASLRGDEKWLGEAFSNLLKNACEHTQPGGHIAVTLEESEAAVFVTVEDDGGGVDRQELPHLFKRFYRAKHQSTEGVGIGLAIVKEVIFRHHGTVSAENGREGLRVTVSFPKLTENLAKS